MSLTATLLLQHPVRLPVGTPRDPHRIAGTPYVDPATQVENLETRARNVARVIDAVRNGHDTRKAISQYTGLALSTLRRITDQMIFEGGAKWEKQILVLLA